MKCLAFFTLTSIFSDVIPISLHYGGFILFFTLLNIIHTQHSSTQILFSQCNSVRHQQINPIQTFAVINNHASTSFLSPCVLLDITFLMTYSLIHVMHIPICFLIDLFLICWVVLGTSFQKYSLKGERKRRKILLIFVYL